MKWKKVESNIRLQEGDVQEQNAYLYCWFKRAVLNQSFGIIIYSAYYRVQRQFDFILFALTFCMTSLWTHPDFSLAGALFVATVIQVAEENMKMTYRPITDMWLLARAKLKSGERLYGSYPGGFPERARALLGVSISDSVLHVCGGKIRYYPYPNAIGPNDKTLDLDGSLGPDFLQDAQDPFPAIDGSWPAILMDPPYSEEDARHYSTGAGNYPKPNLLLKNALVAVRPGGRVGLLHYQLPAPPPEGIGFRTKFIACVGVVVGFNNRIRVFTVFEKVC